jgi:hypothetical protein
MRRAALLTTFLAAAPASAGDTEVLVLDGDVPDGGPDHFFVPFTVPPGTLEIAVHHDDLSDDNILDWGLEDPSGFRGWGGGNSEDAVVGEAAASRSYVAGPISPGEWRVVVGKAKIQGTPAKYSLTVTLRDAPTLPAQPERAAYVGGVDLGGGPRWYAGDFHVHSLESGDAAPPLDEIAGFARGRGLDFVEISDHNTLTQLEFFADAQARHPELLFVPGMEFTTYAGHANAIGATAWVDHKIGQPGVTIAGAFAAFMAQGAAVSINHPVLDLGDVCIGCAWKHETPASLAAVEIATTGLDKAGNYFTDDATAYWDALCATGLHLAALGGSDDHRAGQDQGMFQSPIGDPTTMVYADSLGVDAILAGVRAGRTVVKLQGPADPMVVLSADAPIDVDTITADDVQLTATVTGAPVGAAVRFVRNGAPGQRVDVTEDPFVLTIDAAAPADGEDRWRAEVLIGAGPRTITSHVWLRADPSPATTGDPAPSTGDVPTTTAADDTSGTSGATTGAAEDTTAAADPPPAQGCTCATGPAAPPLFALLLLLRRRPRPCSRP